MSGIILRIDGQEVKTEPGTKLLRAAQKAGVYIPALCDHPDLTPVGYCGLCVVEIEGRGQVQACKTDAGEGMVIRTDTLEVRKQREDALARILSEHPHACLECWRKERCNPFDICLRSVGVAQRCVNCRKNGNCELQRVIDYIGINRDIPYRAREYSLETDNPFFYRDYNLCIVCGRCVRVCRDVRGVGVYALDNEEKPTKVMTAKGGSTIDSGCRFCLACAEVCPTGAIVDRKPEKLNKDRKAFIVPCKHACPAHIDIPRYVDYVAHGKYTEALAVIREKVPFPGALGRVCVHPCEEACRRGELNSGVSIKELKRAAADRGAALWKQNSKIAPQTGKKVAVVGGGPAGLTAAFYLAKKGHKVTVFEALPEAGGMMRVGIPEYRLPRDILAGEVALIKEVGVDLMTNTRIESVDSLMQQGFGAVLLSVGAHKGMKLGVKGEESEGVMDAASFLREVNLGKKVNVGNKVAVIGGGNSAIDSARVALRAGAKEVTLIYRRTREEMPAAAEEIDDAIQEGVKIVYLAAPSSITRKDGVVALECIEMRLGETDASGRRRPEPIKGSEFTTLFNSVIGALGQGPEVPKDFGVKTGKGEGIQADDKTMQTSRNGVYAAGDAVTGPASVIAAIAAGRKAAVSIDKYLGGDGKIDEVLVPLEKSDPRLGNTEGFATTAREEATLLPVEKRLGSFVEVKPVLTCEAAEREGSRCLRCDLRLCLTQPPLAPIRKKEPAGSK